MTDAIYMHYYNALGSGISNALHQNVCTVLASLPEAKIDDFLMPSLNRPILDLIHALAVTNSFHPKKGIEMSWKRYFLVCLIAMGPSYTLRSIVMGEPWAFVGSPTMIPCLIFSILLVGLLRGLPAPIGSLITMLNGMSSVVSVESGVRTLQGDLRVTALSCFLLGILNGSGGAVWNVLVQAWFGHGNYKWETLNSLIPIWILLSLTWNVVFWSKCAPNATTLTMIEYTLFAICVVYSILTSKPATQKQTPPAQKDKKETPNKKKTD